MFQVSSFPNSTFNSTLHLHEVVGVVELLRVSLKRERGAQIRGGRGGESSSVPGRQSERGHSGSSLGVGRSVASARPQPELSGRCPAHIWTKLGGLAGAAFESLRSGHHVYAAVFKLLQP